MKDFPNSQDLFWKDQFLIFYYAQSETASPHKLMKNLSVNTCMLLIYPGAMLFSDSTAFICAPLKDIFSQKDTEMR